MRDLTYNPYLVPISVKGIVFEDGKVWLRHNERNEWELPGGKLDEGEQPEETVVREMIKKAGEFENIGEAGEAKFKQFSSGEINSLNMPDFYKDAINKAQAFLAG
jgi:hypothetical protein